MPWTPNSEVDLQTVSRFFICTLLVVCFCCVGRCATYNMPQVYLLLWPPKLVPHAAEPMALWCLINLVWYDALWVDVSIVKSAAKSCLFICIVKTQIIATLYVTVITKPGPKLNHVQHTLIIWRLVIGKVSQACYIHHKSYYNLMFNCSLLSHWWGISLLYLLFLGHFWQ